MVAAGGLVFLAAVQLKQQMAGMGDCNEEGPSMSSDPKPNGNLTHSRREGFGPAADQHGYRAKFRNWFYLSLTVLVLVDLLDTAARFGQSFRTADVLAGVAPLDSFSEPAIAATLLRREAENLFSSFTEARNDADYPGTLPLNKRASSVTRKPDDGDAVGWKPREMSTTENQLLQRLEKLRATLRELSQDVDQKLLVIGLKNRNANDLVDCFLELLHNCPERPEILEWVEPALDSAESCGRADELQDALEHVLRFQKSLPTAWGLKVRIEKRKAALSVVHKANGR